MNAFPFVTEIQRTESGIREQHFGESGMSLRQWYAGQALATVHPSTADYYGPDGPEIIARDAFMIADAMIEEGNK